MSTTSNNSFTQVTGTSRLSLYFRWQRCVFQNLKPSRPMTCRLTFSAVRSAHQWLSTFFKREKLRVWFLSMEKEDGRVNNRSAALPKSGMRNNLCQESVIHPKRGGPKFLWEAKKGGFIDIFSKVFSLLFFLDFGHRTCFEFPPGRLTPFG